MEKIRGILNIRNIQAKSPEGLSSRSSSDLQEENSTSSAEGFLCPTCFQAFPSASALQDHYECVHSENEVAGDGKGFNCPACRMKLGSDIELKSHFTRHHSGEKQDMEVEAMSLQIKALEEKAALLQGELNATHGQSTDLSKENAKIREERDSFKLMATKQADDLEKLKIEFGSVKTKNSSLESSLSEAEEKIRTLEVQTRPEADDVTLLQEELKHVQKLMDDLTRRREAEKDILQKQCDSVQETCLKLQAEKTELETILKSYPSKEEIASLQEKLSSMSKEMSRIQNELEEKNQENRKFQMELEKCANYQDIKAQLSEKNEMLEEIKRQSSDKDAMIAKLREELKTQAETIEEMKTDRQQLFSKIEEGEGANAAMLQLKENNDRLEKQFLQLQQAQAQAAVEEEKKLKDLHSTLKKVTSELQTANEKYEEQQIIFTQMQQDIEKLKNDKLRLTEEVYQKTTLLTNSEASYKSKIKELQEELENKQKSIDQKTAQVNSLKEQMKEEKMNNDKSKERLECEKQNLDRRLTELGKTLPLVQEKLLDRENKLSESEKKLKQITDKVKQAEEEKNQAVAQMESVKQSYQAAEEKLRAAEKTLKDSESTKTEFCDKISSLNEQLLGSQLKESELIATIEQMQKEYSELREKCSLLEEESKNLRPAITTLQNEKNSLMSDLEKHKNLLRGHEEKLSASEKNLSSVNETLAKSKAHAEKLSRDAKLEKELYLKDKVNLQKQMETLEMDCAKQLSQAQETAKSLENQLEEAEEKQSRMKTTLEEKEKQMRLKERELEEKEAHHTAQLGILTENVETLREDLTSERKKRETLEQNYDEACVAKLDLEAKFKNVLDERKGLIERCLKSEADGERLQKTALELRRKYDECVAALQELGRENQTLQLENMKHITRKWADDSEVTHCTSCGKLFTVTIRKHHCRNCGSIFCNECSSKSATVAASKKPVRVCDICYVEVTK